MTYHIQITPSAKKTLGNRSRGYFVLCTQKQAFETADLRGYTRIFVFDCHSIRAIRGRMAS